jgi:hypothetical protein
MPTKNTTPDQIDAELAAAEAAVAAANAERAQVAERAAAVQAAGEAAKSAAVLAKLREMYVSAPKAARQARSAAHDELMAIANSDVLDFDQLRDAYIRRQERDAECWSAGSVCQLLDSVDELPPSPVGAGAPRYRPPGAVQMYSGETWSNFLDKTIRRRAARAAERASYAITAELDQVGEAAEAETRAQAAKHGVMTVEAPESLMSKYQHATEHITLEYAAGTLDPETDGHDGHARQRELKQQVLEKLLAAEKRGTQDDPSDEPPHRNGDEPR